MDKHQAHYIIDKSRGYRMCRRHWYINLLAMIMRPIAAVIIMIFLPFIRALYGAYVGLYELFVEGDPVSYKWLADLIKPYWMCQNKELEDKIDQANTIIKESQNG